MAIEPRIPKLQFKTRTCARCKNVSNTEDFTKTRSIFYDGYLPICNQCIEEYLKANEYQWDSIDNVCRWADLPFIVKEWDRLFQLNEGQNTWNVYAKIFADSCYESIGWKDYYEQYKKLREAGLINRELPLIDENEKDELRKKWGGNYSDEELFYLEELYRGLMASQNNTDGALQIDRALKICKFSLEIDSRIRSGDKDIDKILSSYEKLVKMSDFTPKNTKNAVDFDSFAEVGKWLERRGRMNKFYDGAIRDVIDETLKNIENYNQRLYINEGGIGDEITERLESLKNKNAQEENFFGLEKDFDLDEYDNAGFAGEDDFEVEINE